MVGFRAFLQMVICVHIAIKNLRKSALMDGEAFTG
jgi:hypothetical protein